MVETRKRGDFDGSHRSYRDLGFCIITDTEYTKEKVEPHQHENPYFTLLLAGNLLETSHHTDTYITAGQVHFQNAERIHSNKKPPSRTRGFHLEPNGYWLNKNDINIGLLPKNGILQDPRSKYLLYRIYSHCFAPNNLARTSTEIDLIGLLDNMTNNNVSHSPKWVNMINDLVHDEVFTDYSLKELSKILGIHPVHVSRTFADHFKISYKDLKQRIKLAKAYEYIMKGKHSLTEVSYMSGFYDQSHFIEVFKAHFRSLPSSVLKNARG